MNPIRLSRAFYFFYFSAGAALSPFLALYYERIGLSGSQIGVLRGISPLIGGFLAVDWLGTLVTNTVGMIFGLVVLRNVLASYMLGLWLMIPWLWFRTRDPAYVIYAFVVNLLFVVAMIPDIRGMIDRKQRGIELDMSASMDMTPMGRGIKKMANRLGLMRD